MNISKQTFLNILAYFVVAILFFTPYQKHLIWPGAEFFPAIDLIVLFIILIHYRVKYWHLFFIGLLLDYLNGTYDGIYPLVLITAFIILRYFTIKMISISYFFQTDVIFALYLMDYHC